MSLYRYKAVGKKGLIEKGVLEVSSSKELKKYMREQGVSLITYSRGPSFSFSRKLRSAALMDLCLHLGQFENAGMPLKQSLEDLYQIQKSSKLKNVLGAIIKDIEGGSLFSKALAQHSSVFDPVFIGLMAVGEQTGHFSGVLRQLILHLKWKDEVQAQTMKALRYPFLMAIVLGSVLSLLMIFLVPELVKFIETFSGNLPYSTRVLVCISGFLSRNLTFFFVIIVIFPLLLIGFFHGHPKGSLWKDHLLDAFPFLGTLRRRIELTRFCHIFAVMIEGGIDILQALQTARTYLRKGKMYHVLHDVEHLIKEGYSLSHAFQKTDFFPLVVIQMIKLGEQTNSLPTTLVHVKDYFNTTLKRHIDHVVGGLEPAMIVCLGCVMAGIIYSTFLPLYNTLSILDY
jgi:type IV pilus assembly protein PilC